MNSRTELFDEVLPTLRAIECLGNDARISIEKMEMQLERSYQKNGQDCRVNIDQA